MTSRATTPRLTPWINAQEWTLTRNRLYSRDSDEIRAGLMCAYMWMDRGRVPTAIESTVNLLEVLLNDCEHCDVFLQERRVADACGDDEAETSSREDDRDLCDDKLARDTVAPFTLDCTADGRMLRLAYTTAIIRFVNELVDKEQKGVVATSITKLAEQIGLPRVFVDIRHDGTHDQLGSLELLRWAAAQALEWLEERYWSVGDEHGQTAITANIQRLLEQYVGQLDKISREQPAALLEKSSVARVIMTIDYVETVPRVMRTFLQVLLGNHRMSMDVIESLVRPLARTAPLVFYPLVAELFVKQAGSLRWLPWVADELAKMTGSAALDAFLSKLFALCVQGDTRVIFVERLVPIWKALGPRAQSSRFSLLYVAFANVHVDRRPPRNQYCIDDAVRLVREHGYCANVQLEGWAEASPAWRPCPLGSVPNKLE